MGFKQLEELTQKDGKDAVFAVVNEANGFPLLLRDAKLRDDPTKMRHVLRVLAIALESHGFGSTLSRAISIIVESNFLDSLNHFNLSVLPCRLRNHREIEDIASDQSTVIDQIVQMCPGSFVMNVQASANSLKFAVQALESNGFPIKDTTKATLSRIHESLADLIQREQDPVSFRKKNREDLMNLHEQEAPEDFKTLSVVPTVEELMTNKKPFVRTNIVQGAYKSAYHYLDVQFRLMKEDFVAPLRDGIREVFTAVQEDGTPFGKKRRRFQVIF